MLHPSSFRKSRLTPAQPAYTGSKPALAEEAGLHRLKAGFCPKKPAYTGFAGFFCRSRLTPARAGSFKAELVPPSSFKQCSLLHCVLLRGPQPAEEERGEAPKAPPRSDGKPARPSSKGPGFSPGRFKAALLPSYLRSAACCRPSYSRRTACCPPSYQRKPAREEGG